MSDGLAKITAWLLDLAKAAFEAVVTLLHDVIVWAFDGILQALAAVIAAIPVPSFMSGGVSIGSQLSGFPAATLYVLGQLGIAQCFAVLAAGIAFRLTRKLFTLGQW